MCLIFYSYGGHPSKKTLNNFLSSNENVKKLNLWGGVGFAWINDKSNAWNYIRRLKIHTTFDSFPEAMLSNKVIVGHIRQIYTGNAEKKIENVHPFSYRNQLFLHNGDTCDFNTSSKLFFKDIDKELRTHIKGHTDTEYIFYMFLTIKKQLEIEIDYDDDIDILFKTTQLLFQYLHKHYKKFRTNFVYVNKSYSVIVRYAFNDTPLPLYVNGQHNRDRLLVTTSPVMDTYKMIPPQTILIVDHDKHTYITKKLNC